MNRSRLVKVESPCRPEQSGAGQLTISRRERKYPLPLNAWESIVRLAQRYLPAERFDGVHDVVSIQTTYLDSPDLKAYQEYVAKKPVRQKVRVRQYVYEGKHDGSCWVEIKTKRYGQSHKRRFRCGVEALDHLLAGRDISDHVSARNHRREEASATYRTTNDLIAEGRLQPVARVEFERLSFQGSDSSRARLTVDRDLRFVPVVWGGDVTSDGRSDGVMFDGCLLEVKYSNVRPQWVGELLGRLSLERASRFSKFARAIEAVGADVVLRRDSA